MKIKICNKIENFTITLGDIVSNIEFSFWSNLFCANYENNIWSTYLKYLFLNKTRKDLFKEIDSIRKLRNRIFNYEPIIFNNNLENIYNLIINLLCIMTTKEICDYIKSISSFERLFAEYKENSEAPLNHLKN